MRILHIITSLYTGGAEKLMVDLLPKMAMNNDVEILLFDGHRTPFFEKMEAMGFSIHSFGDRCNVYNPFFIFRLIPLMKRFDIVHSHNTACQMFVAMANVFVKTRIFTTEHSTSNRRRNMKCLRLLDKWMYRQYHSIITVSDIASQNIKDYIGDPHLKTKTILNGIDVDKFAFASSCKEIDEQYFGFFKSVMIAGFRYEKDQRTLILAHSYLPDNFHLFLVGDGVEKHNMEILVNSLGLEKRIHFLGVRMDIPNILKSTDVVVYSSHREGFGLAAVEGMAAGKPVIASDVDGLHDIVSSYGILFPHEDAKSLANEIYHCFEDTEYANSVASSGRERASNFDISKTAKEYLACYVESLNN